MFVEDHVYYEAAKTFLSFFFSIIMSKLGAGIKSKNSLKGDETCVFNNNSKKHYESLKSSIHDY